MAVRIVFDMVAVSSPDSLEDRMDGVGYTREEALEGVCLGGGDGRAVLRRGVGVLGLGIRFVFRDMRRVCGGFIHEKNGGC